MAVRALRTAAALGIAALGLGIALTAAPAAHAATTAGVISATQRDDLGKKRWMQTQATIQGTTLYALTITHAGERLRGYHGCANVQYISPLGAVLGQSSVQRYGVDGSWVGNNHREVAWNEPIPFAVAAGTAKLTIKHWVC
jgi:hypothetical protein